MSGDGGIAPNLPPTDLPTELTGVWVRADNALDRMQLSEADGGYLARSLQTGLGLLMVREGQVLVPRSSAFVLKIGANEQGLLVETTDSKFLYRAGAK